MLVFIQYCALRKIFYPKKCKSTAKHFFSLTELFFHFTKTVFAANTPKADISADITTNKTSLFSGPRCLKLQCQFFTVYLRLSKICKHSPGAGSYPLETVRADIGGITGSSLPGWEGGRFFKIPLMANESQTIQQNDFEQLQY